MKTTLALLLLLIAGGISSQEIKKNLETTKFEYIEVVEESRTSVSFAERMKTLNYKNIVDNKTSVIGKGLINEEVPGFINELTYEATVELKDSKYRIKIGNVTVKDKTGTKALEELGGFQKKWVKKLNEKLPEIIQKLKAQNTSSEW